MSVGGKGRCLKEPHAEDMGWEGAVCFEVNGGTPGDHGAGQGSLIRELFRRVSDFASEKRPWDLHGNWSLEADGASQGLRV